jgi:HEAT repeat protein
VLQLRLAAEQGAELAVANGERPHPRRRPDRGGTRPVGDQRDLAEEVARVADLDAAVSADDLRLPVEEDIEHVTWLPLADELVPCGMLLFAGKRRDPVDLPRVEVLGQRQTPDDVGVLLAPEHAVILRSRAVLEFFSPRVRRLRKRRDVPGLVEALQKSGPRSRRAAANAFILITDPRAIDALVAALRDPDELVRLNAALALGEFQGRPELATIVEPLAGALADESPLVRSMAASALARAKKPEAVPALVAALDDPDGNVRATVAAVLPTFDDPRVEEALASRRSGA